MRDVLDSDVRGILATAWKVRDGRVVPDPEDVQLGNDALKLSAAVLYADLARSTELVDSYSASFAAEVYKVYLRCASKIIRSEGGYVTAFDGDRVMGVFVGDTKNTLATRAALKINFAVQNIVNPALATQYPHVGYSVSHAVGIDTSELFVARTGLRGSNDLVWAGRAANYAAKLCSLRNGSFATWITGDVYGRINDEVKISAGRAMWEARTWTERNIAVYCSTYTYRIA